ncbi:MAG: TatD family hydrolase [Pseudomonadales bacterium]
MLVDSHCHLNYLSDPAEQIALAQRSGVSAMLCVSVEESTMVQVHALAAAHQNIWASAGQHPEKAAADLDWIEPWLTRSNIVAVGETGLDYHHEHGAAERQSQRDAFAHQLALAQQFELPAIVHTREARADTLAIMAEQPTVSGVLHCFTETAEMASQALAQGYYISFSGIVTFKNASALREIAAEIPLNRLLIETDAPWLAPVPHRGKTNSPALLPHTAALLAELRGLTLTELATLTRENFETLFRVQLT